MSRVAKGHFRRKREALLILRGSTSQFRGHPRNLASPRLCAFSGHAAVDQVVITPGTPTPCTSGAPTLLTRPFQERRWPRRPVRGYNTGGDRSP